MGLSADTQALASDLRQAACLLLIIRGVETGLDLSLGVL